MQEYEDEMLLDEIGRFDKEYVADAGRRPGLDALPDGEYDCEIVTAQLTRTDKTKEPILKLQIKAGQMVVDYAYLFKTQDAVNRLGSDLTTIGFDADRWNGDRLFSRELAAAVPRLPGARFRAKKVTSKPDHNNKIYHNLYINSPLPRLTAQTASPTSTLFQPAKAKAEASTEVLPSTMAANGYVESDIPF